MKYNKKWIGVGSAGLVVIITKQLLNSVGGIRSFPYLIQMFVVILCPILFSLLLKREKQKINEFQYKFLKVIGLFITITAILINVIIILNNVFYHIWEIYKDLFMYIILGLFVLFTIYTIVFIIVYKEKLNSK